MYPRGSTCYMLHVQCHVDPLKLEISDTIIVHVAPYWACANPISVRLGPRPSDEGNTPISASWSRPEGTEPAPGAQEVRGLAFGK